MTTALSSNRPRRISGVFQRITVPKLEHVSEGLFAQFQALIYKETGIWLGTHKSALLAGRLSRRLRLLGLPNMAEYYRFVTQPDQHKERSTMIDCITTNETHFFREPQHFALLSQRIFPRWHKEAAAGDRPKRIRIWSAGCSTGEEAYSLAMMLYKYFESETSWDIQVLGTDISNRVLEKAAGATYPIDKANEIPKDYLSSFMLRGVADQDGLMLVSPHVRKMVKFARLNLHADSYPLTSAFDLIFCRNVLIYFDQKSKKKVISGLVNHLADDGLLFVGHSENLYGVTSDLKRSMPAVYARS